MKIYISNYRYHWISPYTIIENIFFWTDWSKCGRNKGVIEDKDYVDHPAWVNKLADKIEIRSSVWDASIEDCNKRATTESTSSSGPSSSKSLMIGICWIDHS